MLNRRKFLQTASLATGALLTQGVLGQEREEDTPVNQLTILHTNDVHSRIDPFPMDGGRNQGLGGVAARAEVIRNIRASTEQVLLVDAGDIFQGTPYFNFYKGEPEIKAMAAMGYEAVTMGNHDFDAGLENFATQLQHANFPVVIANYDFTNTPMEGKSRPYHIIRKGRLKIGLTGVGIELKGLVPDNLAGNTIYSDPILAANRWAAHLKQKEDCDLVVCLSHLGYRYKEANKVSDEILARESAHIDVIIGGHTHTFLDAPVVYKNKFGSDVIVNQVGWAGILLGRMDFGFQRNKKKNLEASHRVIIGKKTSE
ncbi:metallophosphatase [Flavihumibacter sp. CACIAM 22H1]|uniref:bifunctional metallophosphatase/5'-nucleotidase n=1 Tax=Flavihumibacter sp. CACIAM 22H1 TaxID=1812911 RepID=UPI0007A89ABA|nr:metallophosphatase [Flavihumibacter sp. CACIAM 22H1]KYP15850.1 MAG: metallophosphatase [Flavihumibacter sp. CACIAM 22H1]